ASARLGGVADDRPRLPVDLIQVGAIRREPAVARAAGYGRVETPRGAVARNSRAGGVLRDLQTSAVDVERADVAVAEVRRENESVIRRDREPAQLGWQTGARVDLRQPAPVEINASADGSD